MTLRIGDLELQNPFLLAPLAGITDKTMRSLCSEQGASLTYTEMVSAKGLWYGDSNTERLLEVGNQEGPVAVQLFGSEPEIMERAVWCLCKGKRMKRGEVIDGPEGAGAPALIDLNAGCPVPKIVRNGEGSALLKDLDRLHDVAAAMVRGGSVPVTAKIRIGFAREENVAVEAAKALEAAGVSAVTVHGRTREQYYEGKADWQTIADVKKSVHIPVIGNGDVKCGADAIRMMDETGCDGVMIARGALGNPWIFADAAALWQEKTGLCGPETSAFPSAGSTFLPPTKEERMDMLIRHLDMLVADKGERIAVREMRKHIAWYTKGMHGATSVRRAVNTMEHAADVKHLIKKF